MNSFSFRLVLTALPLLGAAVAPAFAAEAYPIRAITVIVPYSPGGGADVVARLVGQKLSERLEQPVVIDNRAGAGGNIGAQLAARAKPDGYTLLGAAFVAHAISMTLQRDTAGYDLAKDFAPIAYTGTVPLTLVVNPSFPAKSVKEFIAYLKAHPGKVTYASAGTGTTQHLAAELFQLMTQTKMLHVPYKGSGPAIIDVIGGQIASTIETGPVVYSHINAGKLRPLMVARKDRAPALPSVPTAGEAGLPGFEAATIYGFLAPAGTPKPIIDRLSGEIAKILVLPDIKEKFQQQGVEPTFTAPDETARRMHAEIAKWAKVIKEANIKVE